jgi:TolB protein
MKTLWTLGIVALSGIALSETSSWAQSAPAADADPLANLVITGTSGERPLPKIAVIPSDASAMEDVLLRSVVRRDLELSGEFDVLSDSVAPEGLYFPDTAVDVKAWQAKGAESLVRVMGKKISDTKAELRGQAFFVNVGADPVFDKKVEVPIADVRVESHRMADMIIGALTGQNGSFASHMTFALGSGSVRQVFTIDSDGFNAKAISPAHRVALAPSYGPDQQLYYSASENKDIYKVYTSTDGPLKLNVEGSVYGIAFNPDRSQVAVSIGQGGSIKVFTGPKLSELKPASPIGMALRPTFTPTGKLAFAGEGKFSQRIFVDGKPISPEGVFASAPTFCRHPDGIKAIFAVGVGKNTDLVATGETGGNLYRLTQNQGSNGYPACSPDGRLVAFFSTRKSGEGPGLYIMRVDGGRPKRVSQLVGDSLRWDPLPPSKVAPQSIETKRPAAPAPAPEPPPDAKSKPAEKKP